MIPFIKIQHVIVAAALAFVANLPAIHAQVADAPATDESVATPAHDVAVEMRMLFEEFQNETRGEMQRQSDELRDELRQQFLDNRAESLTWWAKSINWWLAFVAIVLTAFGIAVPIALAFRTKKFRHIETEAREAVKKAQDGADKVSEAADAAIEQVKNIAEYERKARAHERKARAIRDNMTGSAKFEQPENIAENFRQHPELRKMIAQAHSLQKSGETESAIRKWRTIANFAGGISKSVVAFAWFSAGYLMGKSEDKISAYSEVIHVDPKNLHAFINRGAAKEGLERYSSAIEDYDEAIRLDPLCAVAYYNRGAVKAKLERYESAIEDFDEAIRLDPEDFYAYFNRGNVKGALGLFNDARSDLQTALELAKEAGNEDRAARISVKIQEIDNLEAG